MFSIYVTLEWQTHFGETYVLYTKKIYLKLNCVALSSLFFDSFPTIYHSDLCVLSRYYMCVLGPLSVSLSNSLSPFLFFFLTRCPHCLSKTVITFYNYRCFVYCTVYNVQYMDISFLLTVF